jgi:hypothetical protein
MKKLKAVIVNIYSVKDAPAVGRGIKSWKIRKSFRKRLALTLYISYADLEGCGA